MSLIFQARVRTCGSLVPRHKLFYLAQPILEPIFVRIGAMFTLLLTRRLGEDANPLRNQQENNENMQANSKPNV